MNTWLENNEKTKHAYVPPFGGFVQGCIEPEFANKLNFRSIRENIDTKGLVHNSKLAQKGEGNDTIFVFYRRTIVKSDEHLADVNNIWVKPEQLKNKIAVGVWQM